MKSYCTTSEEYTSPSQTWRPKPFHIIPNLKNNRDELQHSVWFTDLTSGLMATLSINAKNIWRRINPQEGIFATNIADYKSYGNKEYFVVDRWIQLAEKLGSKHVETIKMMLNTRPGVGNNKTEGREKFEGVYVLKVGKSLPIIRLILEVIPDPF